MGMYNEPLLSVSSKRVSYRRSSAGMDDRQSMHLQGGRHSKFRIFMVLEKRWRNFLVLTIELIIGADHRGLPQGFKHRI
jgi:hypothetical protein